LGLSKEQLDAIYRNNALRLFPRMKNLVWRVVAESARAAYAAASRNGCRFRLSGIRRWVCQCSRTVPLRVARHTPEAIDI